MKINVYVLLVTTHGNHTFLAFDTFNLSLCQRAVNIRAKKEVRAGRGILHVIAPHPQAAWGSLGGTKRQGQGLQAPQQL